MRVGAWTLAIGKYESSSTENLGERVCPVNIPLMLINQKLIKDVNDLFGPYEAGIKYVEGAKPALSMDNENDPDKFFLFLSNIQDVLPLPQT